MPDLFEVWLEKHELGLTKPHPEENDVSLKLPIIGECNEDGSKRLWKTRYSLLENRYVSMKEQTRAANIGKEYFQNKYEGQKQQVSQLQSENQKLKNNLVNIELISKRLDQFIKEFNLPLPKGDFSGTMEKRLEAFFGALWTRCRTEEVDDEVAL